MMDRENESLIQSENDNTRPPTSIINHNNNDDYSTFTPKADSADDNPKPKVEEEEGTTCCCCCSDKPCCCNASCLSKLWKEHRFTIILASSLIISLAVPLYFLVQFAHFKFDYHKECVTCFNEKADFEVIFNQSSGTCELYLQNESYDSNQIVLDPNFCGAPHCQNLELLPGLRLVPYWSVAVSAVFSIILTVGVNLIKYNCYLPKIKKPFVKWKWNEDLVEENPIIRLAEYEDVIREACEKDWRPPSVNCLEEHSGYGGAMERDVCGVPTEDIERDLERLLTLSIFLKTLGLTDPWLFVLLFLFALVHFGFCVYEMVTQPTFEHLNGWDQYQTIYGLFLNSGSIEILWFWLSLFPVSYFTSTRFKSWDKEFASVHALEVYVKNHTSRVPQQVWQDADSKIKAFLYGVDFQLMFPYFQFPNQNRDERTIRTFSLIFANIGLTILVTAPVFFTHIVPGILLFIPYWGWILVPLLTIGMALLRESSQLPFLLSFAGLRLVGSFSVLLLFPMLFNWMVLFYQGCTWSDVMTGEYRLRNTDCYFNALVNGIQIYNVGFAGLIFS